MSKGVNRTTRPRTIVIHVSPFTGISVLHYQRVPTFAPAYKRGEKERRFCVPSVSLPRARNNGLLPASNKESWRCSASRHIRVRTISFMTRGWYFTSPASSFPLLPHDGVAATGQVFQLLADLFPPNNATVSSIYPLGSMTTDNNIYKEQYLSLDGYTPISVSYKEKKYWHKGFGRILQHTYLLLERIGRSF